MGTAFSNAGERYADGANMNELVTMPDQETTLMSIIQRASTSRNFDVDKMERLLAMHERIAALRAETAFNAAMSAAQGEMGAISADATNPQTRSKFASYAKLDKVLRPIYVKHGFALSFNDGETPKTEHVRVLCIVSHTGGFSRTYHKDMPCDGKGAKGGDVMSKTHAVAAAQSYGMRYLLKGIFNVAVGEDDNDGNDTAPRITETQIADIEALLTEVAANRDAFMRYFKIKALSEIRADSYDAVVKQLVAKRKAS